MPGDPGLPDQDETTVASAAVVSFWDGSA